MTEQIAGRSHARVYRTSGKADLHAALRAAAERSGGGCSLRARTPGRRCTSACKGPATSGSGSWPTCSAPPGADPQPPGRRDPVAGPLRQRAQLARRGAPLGRGVAGVDVTVALGVDLDAGVLIGLDPLRYDPLPMGISIEVKDDHVTAAQRTGWHVWERENRAGAVRDARAPQGLKTLVAFAPGRLLDYVRLEPGRRAGPGPAAALPGRAGRRAARPGRGDRPARAGGGLRALQHGDPGHHHLPHPPGDGRPRRRRAPPRPPARRRPRRSARRADRPRRRRLRGHPRRPPRAAGEVQERLPDPLRRRRLPRRGPKTRASKGDPASG